MWKEIVCFWWISVNNVSQFQCFIFDLQKQWQDNDCSRLLRLAFRHRKTVGNRRIWSFLLFSFLCMIKAKEARIIYFSLQLRLGAQSVTLWNTLRDPTQLRRRQCATWQGQDILFIHDYWLGALINCSIKDNNGQLKKRCFCLVAHWRRLNCVGSLKVFHKLTLWAPNLSIDIRHSVIN